MSIDDKVQTIPIPYPCSSFLNEAIFVLCDLVAADAGGETTPDFERAKDAAREYLKRMEAL